MTETETENGPGGSDKKEIPGSGLCSDLLQALKENICQLWDRKEGQAVGKGGGGGGEKFLSPHYPTVVDNTRIAPCYTELRRCVKVEVAVLGSRP